jgi:hypothetical protein
LSFWSVLAGTIEMLSCLMALLLKMKALRALVDEVIELEDLEASLGQPLFAFPPAKRVGQNPTAL